jgi:hypothetical protein
MASLVMVSNDAQTLGKPSTPASQVLQPAVYEEVII